MFIGSKKEYLFFFVKSCISTQKMPSNQSMKLHQQLPNRTALVCLPSYQPYLQGHLSYRVICSDLQEEAEHFFLSITITSIHFLNPIVSNQITRVIIVATKVICCADPVKVRVAIARPLRVHKRFSVSLTASTNHFQIFSIILFS